MFIQNKSVFCILLVGILLLPGSSASADWIAWIEIPVNQRQQIGQLGVQVYLNFEKGCFVHLDDSQVQIMEEKGFKNELIDSPISPGEYFVVFKVGQGKSSYPGTTLWENERLRLVRMPESEALAAKAEGYEMAHLPVRPHALKITKPGAQILSPMADTIIQRLVGDISEPNLRQNILDLQNFNTRYTYSPRCDSAANYLFQRFTDMGFTPEYDVYILNGDTSYNVVATYTGQVHPESIVIACGHFDSYSNQPFTSAPGADDDASGVAGVLEAARVLATANFRWTIMFLAFSGEEQWMKGSYHWVDSVAVPQNLQIEGVYNLDMIGYPAYDTSLMYVTPNTPSIPLAVLAESINVQYNIGLNVANYLDNDAYGDHTPFWEQGFKAVFVIEDSEWGIWGGSNPHYHTTHDTLGNLLMSLIWRTVKLSVGCLATLAGPIHGPGVEELAKYIGPKGELLSIHPNPFREKTDIRWMTDNRSQKTDSRPKIMIYDISGQLVKDLTNHHSPFNHVIWHGVDDSGKDVPAGVYFMRWATPTESITRKIVRLE